MSVNSLFHAGKNQTPDEITLRTQKDDQHRDKEEYCSGSRVLPLRVVLLIEECQTYRHGTYLIAVYNDQRP
jgi:hypothetical protein